MKKLFGWARYEVSPQERHASEQALVNAAAVAVAANAIRAESRRVGARQLQLRQENGFGHNLTNVFRNA